MVEAIAERIFPGFRPRHVVSELAEQLGLQLGNVFRAHPDGPEIQPEGRVHDVEQDRGRQHEPRHPVPLHPGELDAGDRQEGREEQHEHRGRHHPVEEARRQRVPFDLLRQVLVRSLERVGLGGAPLAMRGEQHVARVRDEEQHAGEQRRPEQTPRDVGENPLAPRTPSPP